MFNDWLKNNNLANILVPTGVYAPYPKRDSDEFREINSAEKERRIKQAEEYINFEWPALTATQFMEYQRTGNRVAYEVPHFLRRKALSTLVVGEYLQGAGAFTDDIVNGIWCICEESFWGISPHNGSRKLVEHCLPNIEDSYIDLFAAETAALIAFAQFLLRDELDNVSPLVNRRIDLELNRRVIHPFLTRQDFWWMSLNQENINNWNPWVISNVMSVFLLNEKDLQKRGEGIAKMIFSLSKFVDSYHDDGGCDEGTSYWNNAGGSLFECLDQLYVATKGKFNFFNENKIKEIGRFLYRCYIDDKYFINFADGAAKVNIYKDLVYRYGERIKDSNLKNLGITLVSDISNEIVPEPVRRALHAVINYNKTTEISAKKPYLRDTMLEDIQVMVAREHPNSSKGLYLAVKGGHNSENHNHNDVGNCIIYVDGKPGLIDVGVENYTKETFGENRYSIWTMQSQYHNLPTLNGCMQQAGEEYKAENIKYSSKDDFVSIAMDINSAYKKEANVKKYRRSYSFYRGNNSYIEIKDEFEFMKEENTIEFNFICWKEPVFSENTIIIAVDKDTMLQINYPNLAFEITVIKKETKGDIKLEPVWGDFGIHRITMTVKGVGASGVMAFNISKP